MINKTFRWIAILLILEMILAWKPGNSQVVSAAPDATVNVSPGTVKEGNDFATQVLHDPWDMEQFSDVSKNINVNNWIHIVNPRVANGYFLGTSGDDSQFFPLFPGYGGIDGGKVGVRFPISSSKYHCFYTRFSADSTGNIYLFWYKDRALSVIGVSAYLTYAANQSKVIRYDLNTSTGANAWNTQPTWQGFRIDPAETPGKNFNFDWVRLTDCAAVNTTLSWTGLSGSLEVWAGKGAANPDFLVASGVSATAGSYTLDVQGWEPGTYRLALKDSLGAFHWSTSPLVIDPAPIVTFTRPSFSSGQSLSWEMNSSVDIIADPTKLNRTRCVDYSFAGGVMDLTTLPPSSQPASCIAGGPSDPQIALSILANPVDSSSYRYMTIRMKTDGPWEDINRGWMARLLWETNDTAGNRCLNVTYDISFETGWDNLVIDLADPLQGTAQYAVRLSGASCLNNRKWTDLPAVNNFRFDPNENTTSSSLHQQIDYIRLSKMDRFKIGTPFPIQFAFGRTETSSPAITTYYTTDRSNPTQHAVVPFRFQQSNLPRKVYIPNVNNGTGTPSNTLHWDTTSVQPGQYYICAEIKDGVNAVISCSDAPVIIER